MSKKIYQKSAPASTLDDPRLAIVYFLRKMYGDSRILVGDVARVRAALSSGAVPVLVCIAQDAMSPDDWDQTSMWTRDPRFPFNVLIITDSQVPPSGPFVTPRFTR